MSLEVRTWTAKKVGVVKWEEATREAPFDQHGPLFDRTFHFDEIPKVKFWARLSMDSNYTVAKKGPKVEFKMIEGAEMLNGLEEDMLDVVIEFFSGEEETAKIGSSISGSSISFTESIKSLTEGYSKQADSHYFSEIIGHKYDRQISAKTFTYKIEFEMNYEESAGKARPFPLSLGKRMSENLYLNSDFSDIKILCEDKIFYCHKVILGSRSEVFKSMLTNVDMVEASSGEIKIVDIAANVMETLLYYLYNFDHGKSPGIYFLDMFFKMTFKSSN